MADTSNSIFKKIDSALFKQIDRLKELPAFLKFQEQILHIDEEVRNIVGNILTVFFIIVPIILIIVFYSSNRTLNQEIDKKKHIVETSNSILAKQNSIKRSARFIFSTNPVNNLADFNEQIGMAAASSGADAAKINISNIKTKTPTANISSAEADLRFSDFTTDDLANFINALVIGKRIKISFVNITKSNKTGFLKGTMHILHYSKLAPEASGK